MHHVIIVAEVWTFVEVSSRTVWMDAFGLLCGVWMVQSYLSRCGNSLSRAYITIRGKRF